MLAPKEDTDLREYFKNMTGRDNKFVMPTPQKIISSEEMATYLSRADEAAKLFGMSPRGPIKDTDTELILVTSEEMADAVYREVYETNICSFDLETTGFDHHNDQVVAMQISPSVGKAYYFPFRHEGFDGNLDYMRNMSIVGKILADPTVLKVGHNVKFDYKWFCLLGFREIVNAHDTMIMSHLLDENRPCGHGLKELVENLLNTKMISFSDLGIWDPRKKFKDGLLQHFGHLNILKAMRYACADPDYTLRLQKIFWPLIEKSTFKHLYLYIEQPLMFTLARMELKGMKIDVPYFKSLVAPFQTDIENMTKALQDAAEKAGFKNEADKKGIREPFNPASNPQVIRFVELLGLDTGKRSKTISKKTKQPLNTMVVDKKARASLADKHPAFKLMNDLSEKSKALNTYIVPLVEDHLNKSTGRIHSSFNQHVVDTGRLSSSNPNLQNISKKEEGFGTLIRKGFIAEPGYTLVRADFSQVELRLAAHFARCQPLIDAFLSGQDVHSQIAMKAFKLGTKYPGLKVEDIKENENKAIKTYRSKAKAVSFGLLYGTTKYGLSKNLNITHEQAQVLIDDFYIAYPELREWGNKLIGFASKSGYVEDLMKRRRRFPKDEYGSRRFGWDRAAINAPIQASSASITKWSMVRIEEALLDYDAEMVSTVHDEVIVESKKEQAEEVRQLITKIMEEGLQFFGIKLLVPLLVESDVRDNWAEE